MSHYTVQVFRTTTTWRGKTEFHQVWVENFDTYPSALVRSQWLSKQGWPSVLHDWGTDPGPEPEPLLPGVDNDNPDSWEYAKAQRQIDKLNQSHGDIPF